MTFAQRLVALRKAAGMTQQQLADKLGVAVQSVSRWEQGPSEPSWHYVQALADALGCSCEAFRDPPTDAQDDD